MGTLAMGKSFFDFLLILKDATFMRFSLSLFTNCFGYLGFGGLFKSKSSKKQSVKA
jgi:hypothetical protein